MGGLGSGNHWRYGTRSTCEASSRIDLRFMRKAGLLKTGTRGTLSWSRGGEKNGSIQYRVHPHSLELDYKTRPYGGVWTPVTDQIALDSKEQPFGGTRLFMICPRCHKRCLVLYGGSYFRCRKCSNLAYASQNEAISSYNSNKARQIRQRLGCNGGIDDPFPPKPKGMHWATYERLENQYFICIEQIQLEFDGWITRFGGRE